MPDLIDRSAWQESTIGELATLTSGGTPSGQRLTDFDGSIPWVSVSDLTRSGKWLTSTKRGLSAAGLSGCAARLMPAGTVLLSMYAMIGESAISKLECCSSQAILGIQPNTEVLLAEYLYYCLQQQQSELVRSAQHGAQANLNRALIAAHRIVLPPISE